MQVLEDHEQRLDLALAEEQAFDGVERALAALLGIEIRPLLVLPRHVQEAENRRQEGAEPFVESEELPRDLFADLAMRVAVRDLEVAPQEVDDRKIAGCPAVRDRAGFHDAPVLRAVGAGELVEQARLAQAGLAHDCDELAVAIVRESQGSAEMLELRVAANESR